MSGPEDLPPPGVPPAEAIAFFRSKGYRIGFSWEDVFRAEHARWFTVAKAMSRDLLEDIRAAVDSAIADGTTLEQFKKDLRPKLEARGWWGRKRMIDPLTGKAVTAQLGSPRRLKTIFNTNVRTAYAAGKWERIQRVKAAFPFLEYSSVMDGRERPEHHAWHGTILPVDHPWWDTHYPPCDWECRCSATPRTARMVARRGKAVAEDPPKPNPPYTWTNKRTGETGTLERGVGKGWDYNVGKEYLRGLAPSPIGDGTDEVGAAAALDDAQAQLVARFVKAFGVVPGREAIWRDRDGWPLAIGRGWFIGADGGVRVPPNGVIVDRIAAAIAKPDGIAWRWIDGRDGRALLVRRYHRTTAGVTMIVDIGGEGWNWRLGRADELAPEEVGAAYDPRQARDAKGRWSSGGRAGLAVGREGFVASLNDRSLPNAPLLRIGDADGAVTERLTALGATVRGRWVMLDGSRARHTLDNHGADAPRMAGQRPMTPAKLMTAHRSINGAQSIAPGNPPTSREGRPVFKAVHKAGRTETSVVFDVRRRGLVVHTMYQHALDGQGRRVRRRGGKKSPA